MARLINNNSLKNVKGKNIS